MDAYNSYIKVTKMARVMGNSNILLLGYLTELSFKALVLINGVSGSVILNLIVCLSPAHQLNRVIEPQFSFLLAVDGCAGDGCAAGKKTQLGY